MKNREKMISLFIDLQRCHDGDLDQLSKTPTNSGYGLTLKLSHIGGLNLRVIFGTSKLIIGFGIIVNLHFLGGGDAEPHPAEELLASVSFTPLSRNLLFF